MLVHDEGRPSPTGVRTEFKRAPSVFASLHVDRKRFALKTTDTANSAPRQGSASPADTALDSARRSPEDINDQGEALLRIARSQSSSLSLWSDFQARKTRLEGP
jgi:hypothetical protein